MSDRHSIPSVDRAIRALADFPLPRQVLAGLARRVFAELRSQGDSAEHAALTTLRVEAQRIVDARIQPVINATGVIIHTNLGRSPLCAAAVQAVCSVAAAYSTLEFELGEGQRGGRAQYAEVLLAAVCESQAATMVNNCAAALVLILHHFTRTQRKEVIVSRGELVQIGGGFRVPEILEAGGATLREVGTTNRTDLEDYARAVSDSTALILKIHRSNFWMEGFVASPTTRALAGLAGQSKIPLVVDLGSGALPDVLRSVGKVATNHGPEPTPAEALRAGAALVCFSGDKLFGGPQAGIIAGDGALIEKLKGEPLFRALRCDKMTLAALEITAETHLAGAIDKIPLTQMLGSTLDILRLRAQAILNSLRAAGIAAAVVDSMACVGGGSLPQTSIPSIALEVPPPDGIKIKTLAQRLRRAAPPIIGRIEHGALRLDLRTVFPHQDPLLVTALQHASSST